MGTVTKIKAKSGVRWKGLIRRGHKKKSKTFLLKSSAKSWVQEMERGQELAVALGIPGQAIYFKELANEYMQDYSGKDHTRANRVQFWVERIGKTRLTDISATMIKRHLEDYLNGNALSYGGIGSDLKTRTRKLDRKRSPASRNRMKAALAAVLAYAREKEYLPAGATVTSAVPVLRENNKRHRYLSDDERERLLQACKESEYERLYLLVLIALTTGCRKSEILNLRWKDVNFDGSNIYFSRTKNEDEKTVPLAQPVITEMKRFRGTGGTLVFPGKRKPWNPITVWRDYFGKAKKAAVIKNFRFHDCRHTVGSDIANNGGSYPEIGAILGHKTAESSKRYAHIRDERKQEIIDSLYSQDDDEEI